LIAISDRDEIRAGANVVCLGMREHISLHQWIVREVAADFPAAYERGCIRHGRTDFCST
jgi:hypothetical protein